MGTGQELIPYEIGTYWNFKIDKFFLGVHLSQYYWREQWLYIAIGKDSRWESLTPLTVLINYYQFRWIVVRTQSSNRTTASKPIRIVSKYFFLMWNRRSGKRLNGASFIWFYALDCCSLLLQPPAHLLFFMFCHMLNQYCFKTTARMLNSHTLNTIL